MAREISPERKTLYYVGMVISGIGLLMFLSVFISGALNFGDFTDFEGRTRSMGLRAVVGMIMMIGGGAITGIGAKGLAGSGLLLDPEQAREDVEPYARMGGGLLKDALDEADIDLKNVGKTTEPEQIVKIRCPNCKHLNPENAKFCNECGKKI